MTHLYLVATMDVLHKWTVGNSKNIIITVKNEFMQDETHVI